MKRLPSQSSSLLLGLYHSLFKFEARAACSLRRDTIILVDHLSAEGPIAQSTPVLPTGLHNVAGTPAEIYSRLCRTRIPGRLRRHVPGCPVVETLFPAVFVRSILLPTASPRGGFDAPGPEVHLADQAPVYPRSVTSKAIRELVIPSSDIHM